MFPTAAADKLLQRDLEFSSASKPCTVDSIAGPINIARPDALKAKQNIALQQGSDLLQLVGKPDYGFRAQVPYRSKGPLVGGPIIRCHKLDLMAGAYQSF